jgi:hypothetical protein
VADDIIDKLSRPTKECWDCAEWFCDYGCRRPCDCHDWDDIHAAAKAEIERLRRWKAEATEVLKGWDAVANMVPVRLGDRKSDAVAAEIIRLRQEINRLTALRIADRMLPQRHGWRKRRG